MTTPAIIMMATVFAVGVPSAWRNPTAAALVISWISGQVVYLMTGDNLSVEFYACADIFVISVIMAKHEACNELPYRGLRYQLGCFILERSVPDRIVLMIFPVSWYFYIADLHPYYTWWSLYWLVMAQFFAAGWESFQTYRRGPRAASDTPDNPGALLVAYGSGGYG